MRVRQPEDDQRGTERPVPAGTAVTVHVAYSKPMTSGQNYKGELQLGPTVTPSLLTVPIVVNRQ
jgi:hypothetical protein